MRTELIDKEIIHYEYNEEPAEYDEYSYVCLCGKGKIVETTRTESTEKLDNWTVFLNKLNPNDGFDAALKEYLQRKMILLDTRG